MSYRAYDADLFLGLPMPGKSGLTAQVDFIHYDGAATFPAFLSQNDPTIASANQFSIQFQFFSF